MDDFGGVRGKWQALFAIFLGNHLKDVAQLGQSCVAGRHQRVTARECWDFRDPCPVTLAVQNRPVVSQCHYDYPFLSVAV